jgi:hypothetical protein
LAPNFTHKRLANFGKFRDLPVAIIGEHPNCPLNSATFVFICSRQPMSGVCRYRKFDCVCLRACMNVYCELSYSDLLSRQISMPTVDQDVFTSYGKHVEWWKFVPIPHPFSVGVDSFWINFNAALVFPAPANRF